jgi:hypothetical protein
MPRAWGHHGAAEIVTNSSEGKRFLEGNLDESSASPAVEVEPGD